MALTVGAKRLPRNNVRPRCDCSYTRC